MLLVCVTPPIKAGPADAKIPASLAGIADLLRVLKHLKFALNVAFFVRHEYFLHPKLGNLQEVSRESVHIYTQPAVQDRRFRDTRDLNSDLSVKRVAIKRIGAPVESNFAALHHREIIAQIEGEIKELLNQNNRHITLIA